MRNLLFDQCLCFKGFGLGVIPIFSEIILSSNGNCDFYGNQLVYAERVFKYNSELINEPDIHLESCWENAIGIGLLIGHNNLRCLKIENAYPSDIQILLSVLRLPLDYSWIINGPFGDYYIIFKANQFMIDFDLAELVKEYNIQIDSFKQYPKMHDISGLYFREENNERLELNLMWKYSIVFLPLATQSPSNLNFSFEIPNKPPVFLPTKWLDKYFSSLSINGKRFIEEPKYYLNCFDEDYTANGFSDFNINSWKNIPFGKSHFEFALDINNVLDDINYLRNMDYSYLYETLFICIESDENCINVSSISWIWKCLYTSEVKQGSLSFRANTPMKMAADLALFNDILKEVKIIATYDFEVVFSMLNRSLKTYNLSVIEYQTFDFIIDLKRFSDNLKIENKDLTDLYNVIFDEKIDYQSDSSIRVGLMYDCFFNIFNNGVQYDLSTYKNPTIINFDILMKDITLKYAREQ